MHVRIYVFFVVKYEIITIMVFDAYHYRSGRHQTFRDRVTVTVTVTVTITVTVMVTDNLFRYSKCKCHCKKAPPQSLVSV